MSLLEDAKQRTHSTMKSFQPGDEDRELALAWAHGEATMTQVAAAWGRMKDGRAISTTVYLRLAESLRTHILLSEKK